ncbi:MAG: beta-propeller fold lactonase family protein [Caldimonas sp.]
MTTVVYVANADSHDLSVLRLDPASGAVTPQARVDAGGTVMPLAVSVDRRHLYASIRSEPLAVATFAVDPRDGNLSAVGRSPLPASSCWIGLDRSGRFLLSASYGGSQVAVSPIDSEGVAGPARQALATAPNAHSIQTDPGNRFAFVACLGGDRVMAFRFDAASGALEALPEPAWRTRAGAGPRHFAFHPTAPFVYLLNELDATVDALEFHAETARFGHVQTIDSMPPGVTGKPWAADLHFTPDGRFLYTSERRSSTLAAFAVDAQDGGLKALGTVETATEPRGFAIDASGRWLLAAGQASNRLRVHAIDAASGALSMHAELEVGRNPNWVEIVELP